MEHFEVGDVIITDCDTTFYDLKCRPYTVRAGTLTHVLEADATDVGLSDSEVGQAIALGKAFIPRGGGCHPSRAGCRCAYGVPLLDKVYAVTLLLPDGSLRKYRAMSALDWKKVSTTA